MSDLKGLIRGYLGAVAAGDTRTSEAIYAGEWISYGVGGAPCTGIVELRANSAMFRAAFPGMTPTIHDQVVEGDCVVTRLTRSGVHQGDFAGQPTTNKIVNIDVMRMDRFDQEWIRETWVFVDTAGLMRQVTSD